MGIAGKILIVDDEQDALDNCRRILSRGPYDCLTECNPTRALDVIQRERPGQRHCSGRSANDVPAGTWATGSPSVGS